MAITVDYSTTPFTIEIPKSDLTLDSGSKYNLDVDTFWQLLRDYSDSEESMPFPIIYTRIPATASTPSITEINDDYYQLQFEDGLYSVNIINGNTNIRDVEVKNQVSVNTNNTTGFIDPTYLQFGTFDGYVWIDPSTSNTGTTYPVGTPAAPVNNDSDAQLIANAQGLYNLFARGNITVTGVHSGIKFWGRSPRTTQITIDPSASISGCEFQSCLLSGDLGSNGSSYMITVALKNVTGIFGHLENCVLREGTNTLSTPNGFVMLNKCSAVSAVNPGTDIPIFDLAGSGRVASRSLDGEIIFQNKSSGNDCSLDLDGAVVTLDSTITAGTWRFSGIGKVIDNSGGTAVIDTAELVSPASVADAVWDEVISKTEHNGAQSAGRQLRQAGTLISADGEVNDASATATSFITTLTETTNDFYNDQTIVFTGGALEGQSRIITGYDGTTKRITVEEAFSFAPSNTDDFDITSQHVHPVSQIADGVGDNTKVVDIFRRLDLDTAVPNTHKNDNTEITNSEFDLTTTDNGDGTYTVTRTNNP